jgi:type I restriction enzyme R subunit
VREAFSTFINAPSLNGQQIRFLDLIVHYLSTNGFLETEKLSEALFTEVSAHGLLGVFNLALAGETVSTLERVNQYAEVV